MNDELLIEEMATWSEMDKGVLFVLKLISRLGSENKQVEDVHYNSYKHLEIFYKDKKLNDKGLAIVRMFSTYQPI